MQSSYIIAILTRLRRKCIHKLIIKQVGILKLFLLPSDWQVGLGDGNGIKLVTAFYPKEASNSNGIYACIHMNNPSSLELLLHEFLNISLIHT